MDKNKIIKILGAVFVTVGSLRLIWTLKDSWWALAWLFRPSSFATMQVYLISSATSLFFFIISIILPLAIFIAGFGIIRIKRWGWILAVTVCSVTFIIKFIGTMNFAFAVYMLKDNPMPPIPKDAVVVGHVSMWPTYIYGIASGLLILVLTRDSIKKEFHN
jgi:hypothetical protein